MDNKNHPCKDCRFNARIPLIYRTIDNQLHCPRLKRTLDIGHCREIIRFVRTRAWRFFEKAQKYIE